jgi:hypothetical protein
MMFEQQQPQVPQNLFPDLQIYIVFLLGYALIFLVTFQLGRLIVRPITQETKKQTKLLEQILEKVSKDKTF